MYLYTLTNGTIMNSFLKGQNEHTDADKMMYNEI